MHKLAPDVFCMWNPVIERWQVLQQRRGAIMLASGSMNGQYRLMWTIEEDGGAYRHPSNLDMMKLAQTVTSSHKLWGSNTDLVADSMDANDIERERKIAPAAADRIKFLAKEAARLNFRRSRTFT